MDVWLTPLQANVNASALALEQICHVASSKLALKLACLALPELLCCSALFHTYLLQHSAAAVLCQGISKL